MCAGTGIFDHLTWRCMGNFGVLNQKARMKGMCIATDAGGDQVVSDFAPDPIPVSDKDRPGTATIVGGTGEYTGITGAYTFVVHWQETHSPQWPRRTATLRTTPMRAPTSCREISI
jgi:hypothetical protein